MTENQGTQVQEKVQDKYDIAIAYLTEHLEDIISAWGLPDGTEPYEIEQAHCLFQYLSEDGHPVYDSGDRQVGCLTQIKSGARWYRAATRQLTKKIVADDRIPDTPYTITVESLPVFAEYQRLADRTIRAKQLIES